MQVIKDLIGGLCSGVTQVIIMQPFDLVKIRLQNQMSSNPYYNGLIDCVKKVIH